MIVRTLGAEELAGDVKGFTSHDDNLLTFEELLGHSAGKAAEEVALAINHNLDKQCDQPLSYFYNANDSFQGVKAVH